MDYIYENYCKIRDSRECTDAKVSRETGVTKSTFSDWKSGRCKPKIEKLQKIADYFNVPLSYFFSENEDMKEVLNEDIKEVKLPQVTPTCSPSLTEDERELLDIYRGLERKEQLELKILMYNFIEDIEKRKNKEVV